MRHATTQIRRNIILSGVAIIGMAAISIVCFEFLNTHNFSLFLSSIISILIFLGLSIPIPFQFANTLKLLRDATIDSLTGLLNRNIFIELLDQELAQATKDKRKFHLMILDLNKFKQINDTLGHPVGDQVLKEIATKLKETIRSDDILARLGGDEFAIIIPDDPRNEKSYELLAAKLSKVIAVPLKINNKFLHVSVSIGIASFPTSGTTANDLMRYADIAMYSAKKNQKDYIVFRPEDEVFSISDLSILGEIQDSISNKEFELWYQPKKNSKTNNIDSLECLIRWRHPIKGLLAPFHFIPAAESSGMIKYITQFVIKEAANSYKLLLDAGHNLEMSVNVSANDVIDPSMMSTIIKSIVRSDMPPEKLVLEVTETAIMHDPSAAHLVLVALESLGIKISLDDFGTGHSTLTYLKNFPISEIKLDRSFITDIATSNQGYNIVKSTIGLSHNLNAITVGEGVENEAIENVLIELGCDFIQGYHVARPMPLDQLIPWLSAYKILPQQIKVTA